ncbi:hypothetical protein AUR64_09485 [Haloprofundus marisrubri]|uniref:Response regulatory domain-containing protein n=1 Tax=Haloprofundus marisrubri TaxID=1514971 RepID=A0A0W1R979_9EURY|nr:bacterio-opsin activator domain-containing protein [Haloprofundus marisrubri]KTG09851.1 hypothetical protein AUR64_09485 [Haloprofundus marisrubri]
MSDRLLAGQTASNVSRPKGARILLAVSHDENRSLLARTLESDHDVVEVRPEEVSAEDVDLCILDPETLSRHADALEALKDDAGALHLPLLLVVPERNLSNGDVWRQLDSKFSFGVDDLIRTPVSKTELRGRLQSLLRVRQQSVSLDRQRERLDRLNRVNSVIREVNAALVGAKSRKEVEERVCTRLTNAGPYCYVRICEPRATRDALTVSTKVGDLVDPPLPETTTNGDRSQRTAAWRSFTGRETLSGGLRTEDFVEFDDDDSITAWRQWADSGGVRGFACVPIRYRDTVYGVLEVYTSETDSFDEEERSVLDELGQTIGHTTNAVESKRLLLTRGATEVELRIDDGDDPVLELAVASNVELRLEGVTGSDPSVEYYTVDGDAEALIDKAAETPGIVRSRIVRESDEGALVELVFEAESIAEALTDLGMTVDTIVADGRGASVVALLPQDGDVGTALRGLRERYDAVELRSRQQVERRPLTEEDFVTAVESELTARQRSVLKAAYLAGYFDQPRESSGKDVASSLDISSATFHQHIRAGERKLVSKLFEKVTLSGST